MPNFANYFTSSDAIDAASRAVDAWNRITDKPTTLTLQGAVSAIVVRIEHDGRTSDQDSNAGHAASLRCTVFGVKDHPDAAVIDTVIAEGDRFGVGSNLYEVERIITPPGEVQAFCVSV